MHISQTLFVQSNTAVPKQLDCLMPLAATWTVQATVGLLWLLDNQGVLLRGQMLEVARPDWGIQCP